MDTNARQRARPPTRPPPRVHAPSHSASMPKPTLIQSILNRPSQTYHHPPAERDYHSNRKDLFRIAHTTARPIPGQFEDSGIDTSTPGNSDTETYHSSATTLDRSSHRPSSQSRTLTNGSNTELSHSQSVRTSQRKRTPIHSIASSSSFLSFKPDDSSHTRVSSLKAPSSRSQLSSRGPSSKGNDGDIEESTDDDDDDRTDIFYTPRTSLASSPRSVMLEPQALASALFPLHTKSNTAPLRSHDDDTPPVSRTSSGSSLSSGSSSKSVVDDVPPSVFSPSVQSTTVVGSERGGNYFPTVDSSRSRTLSAGSATSARSNGTIRRQQPINPHTQNRQGKLTYTDMDWAEDVRWLAPPKMPAAAGARRHDRTLPPDLKTLESELSGHRRPPGRGKGDRRSKRSRHSRGRMSALWEEDESEGGSTDLTSSEPSRSTTPVLETPTHSMPSSPLAKVTMLPLTTEPQEENTPSESTHSESTPDVRLEKYARGQRRTYSTTASLFRPLGASNADLPTHPMPNPVATSTGAAHTNGYTGLTLPHAGYSNAKGKAATEGHVDLVRAGVAQSSMATIEVIRGVAATVSGGSPASISSTSSPTSSKRRPSLSFSLGRSFTFSLKSKKRESATPVHLRGGLPLPVAFTAHIAPPSFVPESHVLVQVHAVGLDTLDSLIVHDKSGMNGHAGGLSSGTKGVGGGKAGFIPGRSFAGKVIECGWAVREEVCKRGEWVVGLLDVKKCGALTEFILVERHRVCRAPPPRPRTTTLFPPPRRRHLRSNSLPVNGQSYAHSPLAPPGLTVEELALLPLCGVPAHRAIRTFADVLAPPLHNSSKAPVDPAKRSDKRALVLLGHDGPGALAVQMLGQRGVRIAVQIPESAMLDDDPAPEAYAQNGNGNANGSSNGHGNGDARGRKLSLDIVRTSPSKPPDKGKGKEGQRPSRRSKQERTEARLRSWGVEDIYIGEPLDVLRQLAEEGQSFDIVLDTVGGVAIWEAAQKLLTMDWSAAAARSSLSLARGSLDADLSADPAAISTNTEHPAKLSRRTTRSRSKGPSVVTHAQFTTLVGDTPHRPIPTAQDNLRGGLRSLRRSTSTTTSSPPAATARALPGAGRVREKRVVGYAWVSVAADVDMEGEDVRDSLGAVVRLAETGALRSLYAGGAEGEEEEEELARRVVPFDKAAEVFRRGVVGPLGVLADGGTCAVRLVG